jgi:hypothetical protein
MTGIGYTDYIRELIEGDIDFHENAVAAGEEYSKSPLDKEWTNRHRVCLRKAKEALSIHQTLNGSNDG